MSGFPMQLAWRRFVGLLRDLGYRPLKSHRGSVRQFFNPTRSPNVGSFHEPHSGDTLRKATLFHERGYVAAADGNLSVRFELVRAVEPWIHYFDILAGNARFVTDPVAVD
jgi:hypothetical protein